MRFLAVLLLLAILTGCSGAPDDAALKEAIKATMMEEHLPPVFVDNLMGGFAFRVDLIDIEDTSKETEEPNALMEMMGSKARDYWSVTIVTKGEAQIGSSRILAQQLSSDPNSTKQFNLRIAVKVYEKEDGSLEVSIPTVF